MHFTAKIPKNSRRNCWQNDGIAQKTKTSYNDMQGPQFSSAEKIDIFRGIRGGGVRLSVRVRHRETENCEPR